MTEKKSFFSEQPKSMVINQVKLSKKKYKDLIKNYPKIYFFI